MRVRVVVAAAIVAMLGACAGHSASRTAATTSLPPAHALHYVFDHEQIVVMPPSDGQAPVWSRAEALAVVKQAPFFRGTSPQVWLGTYNGRLGWLAIAGGLTVAPSLGQPMRGYELAVYADGVSPAQALSSLAQTGGQAPDPNAPPPRHRYNGRLHLTFLTGSGGPVGGSLAEWMMQPATGVHARLALAEALRRGRTTPLVGIRGARVYFGLFTGLDNHGTLHQGAPAWMVFKAGVSSPNLGGPCCNHKITKPAHPSPSYGASVISDDGDWVSGQLFSSGSPLVD